jgi:hypothetical protein
VDSPFGGRVELPPGVAVEPSGGRELEFEIVWLILRFALLHQLKVIVLMKLVKFSFS